LPSTSSHARWRPPGTRRRSRPAPRPRSAGPRTRSCLRSGA
jgi:hypothetical protein